MIEYVIVTGVVVGVWAARDEIKYSADKYIDYKKKQNMDPTLNHFQRLLFSEPNTPEGGEVMVRFDSGQEVPFHEHDTEVHDDTELIEKEATDGVVWYDGSKIEAVWIHRESLDEI